MADIGDGWYARMRAVEDDLVEGACCMFNGICIRVANRCSLNQCYNQASAKYLCVCERELVRHRIRLPLNMPRRQPRYTGLDRGEERQAPCGEHGAIGSWKTAGRRSSRSRARRGRRSRRRRSSRSRASRRNGLNRLSLLQQDKRQYEGSEEEAGHECEDQCH